MVLDVLLFVMSLWVEVLPIYVHCVASSLCPWKGVVCVSYMI